MIHHISLNLLKKERWIWAYAPYNTWLIIQRSIFYSYQFLISKNKCAPDIVTMSRNITMWPWLQQRCSSEDWCLKFQCSKTNSCSCVFPVKLNWFLWNYCEIPVKFLRSKHRNLAGISQESVQFHRKNAGTGFFSRNPTGPKLSRKAQLNREIHKDTVRDCTEAIWALAYIMSKVHGQSINLSRCIKLAQELAKWTFKPRITVRLSLSYKQVATCATCIHGLATVEHICGKGTPSSL
jgi:hypothetical protein